MDVLNLTLWGPSQRIASFHDYVSTRVCTKVVWDALVFVTGGFFHSRPWELGYYNYNISCVLWICAYQIIIWCLMSYYTSSYSHHTHIIYHIKSYHIKSYHITSYQIMVSNRKRFISYIFGGMPHPNSQIIIPFGQVPDWFSLSTLLGDCGYTQEESALSIVKQRQEKSSKIQKEKDHTFCGSIWGWTCLFFFGGELDVCRTPSVFQLFFHWWVCYSKFYANFKGEVPSLDLQVQKRNFRRWNLTPGHARCLDMLPERTVQPHHQSFV